MRIEYYSNKEESIKLKKEANAKGESTIHDDFIDSNESLTDGKSGKLTFVVIPKPDNTKFIRRKKLQKKLNDNSITFEELKEYLRLK